MTTTTIIDNKTAADVTQTGSVANGSSVTFGVSGLSDKEGVVIEQLDDGGGYSAIRYLHESGKEMVARMSVTRTVIKVNGPIDYRINKPATANGVSIVEYS